MTRQPRLLSQTGIYHVMLRGINKQLIFETSSDYRRFTDLMASMVAPKDELGKPLPQRCTFFAYCLMPNHVHLLIAEGGESLATVMKRMATAYAQYYNVKYERSGHLFQDRFRSEPVNDENYFLTLLRYIHQNPVSGELCRSAEDYPWSSWREYLGTNQPVICHTSAVRQFVDLDTLKELVNEPLAKTTRVLDFDRKGNSLTDDEVAAFLRHSFGLTSPCHLQNLAKQRRREILRAAKDIGATIRQLSRLSGLGEKIVRNA